MAKKLISILFLILLCVGCEVKKTSYITKATYYKPSGEVFKEYSFSSSIKPKLDTKWDGRQYVYLGALPMEELPAAPQGWMIELKVTRETK